MLQELYIRDFAIIQDLRLEFGKGLNLMTGETGAGKSIIIEALQILLGGRCSSENIREGAKESTLEGTFSIPQSFPLRSKYLELNYLQEEDREMTIRRIISGSGRNRCYLNGNMVNLAALSELSETLLEVHGQNQQIALFKKSVQLSLLDSFAGLNEVRGLYESYYAKWAALSSSIQELKEGEREKREKEISLQFQIEELEGANLDPEEEIRLIHEKEILSQSEFLRTKSEEAYHILSERDEFAILTELQAICRNLIEISSIDSRIQPIFQLISSAQIQLKEGGTLLRDYREKNESQPEALEKIEKRLFFLSQLKKKYALSIPELIQYLNMIKNEAKKLSDLESDILSLQTELLEIERNLDLAAADLSKKRRKTAKVLEQAVIKELKGLKIDQPEFKVSFIPVSHPSGFSRYGREGVSFLISMNPGFPPDEIEKVASGGELSRLMLVLKTILTSHSESVSVLVFDEIDTGVGGAVAEFIGKKLWKLSRDKQVICITHLPQIASFGESHFNLTKQVKNGATDIRVKLLDHQERIQEIGRMLGGSTITSKTLKYAEELIANTANI